MANARENRFLRWWGAGARDAQGADAAKTLVANHGIIGATTAELWRRALIDEWGVS